MSQQINLYDPELRLKRELLTALNLAVLAAVLLLAIGGWGTSVRMDLAAQEAESQSLTPKVKELQDQMIQIGKQFSESKPDARLEAELTAARAGLTLRSEIVAALKNGIGAAASSYAEYLRGLARQSPSGLWLTGIGVGENSASMEIQGRMVDPALLPEYIRRLNGELAFKGRSFTELKVAVPQAEPTNPAGAADAKPAAPAPFLEFMLTSAPAAAPALLSGGAQRDAAHAPGEKQ